MTVVKIFCLFGEKKATQGYQTSSNYSGACSVSEPVGDWQQLVSLLQGLNLGVGLVIHGFVASAGIIQKLLF